MTRPVLILRARLTVPPPVTPDPPSGGLPAIPAIASCGALAADGPLSGSWGLWIAPEYAAQPDSALRLYNTMTGAEVPTTAPVRLPGAERWLRIGAQNIAPSAGVPYEYRFSGSGLPRLTATLPWVGCAIWPAAASYRCRAEAVLGPLTPLATLTGLPAAYTRLLADYPRAQSADVAARAAGVLAGNTDEIAFGDRQIGSVAYDFPAHSIAYGESVDGATGHRYVHDGLVRLTRYVTQFAMFPGYFQWAAADPARVMIDAVPAAAWLTGDDTWRTAAGMSAYRHRWQYGAYTPRAGDTAGSQAVQQNGGNGFRYLLDTGQARGIGNVLRASLIAARLQVTHSGAGDSGLTPPFGPEILDAQLAALWVALGERGRLPGQGPLAGTFGSAVYQTTTSTNPAITGRADYEPNQPGTITFQAWFTLGVLRDILRAAERGEVTLAAGRATAVAAFLRAGIDYLAARAVTQFGATYWSYQVPIPGPQSTGLEADTELATINGFAVRPLLWAAATTGQASYRTLADAALAGLVTERFRGGTVPVGNYANTGAPVGNKAFDEASRHLLQNASARSA